MKKLFVTILVFSFFLSVSGITNILEDGRQLSIYPNPASKQLTINIKLEFSLSTDLRIIDLTGKTVKELSQELAHENGIYKARLDISDLPAGIYFVRIKQQDQVFSKKLIVR